MALTDTIKKECTDSTLAMLSRYSVEHIKENELTRNSSGNARAQSSQLAEPLWTDADLKLERNRCPRVDLPL